jgi:hypothetical protein
MINGLIMFLGFYHMYFTFLQQNHDITIDVTLILEQESNYQKCRMMLMPWGKIMLVDQKIPTWDRSI